MINVGVLSALCALAVLHDLLSLRIPNSLVLAGIALGLLFQAFAPNGEGLFSGGTGLGLSTAVLGGLTGLAILLPMYALRAMGAGDVKLLAMVGVWLGPQGVAWAGLWTLLAGGVLAVVVALWSGVLRQVCLNLYVMVTTSVIHGQGAQRLAVEPRVQPTGRLPYAVAIACGTTVELLRLQLIAGT